LLQRKRSHLTQNGHFGEVELILSGTAAGDTPLILPFEITMALASLTYVMEKYALSGK
jgi:hypothetical protein